MQRLHDTVLLRHALEMEMEQGMPAAAWDHLEAAYSITPSVNACNL